MPTVQATCLLPGLHGNSGVRARRRAAATVSPLSPFCSRSLLAAFRSAESHYDFAVTGNQGEKESCLLGWSRHSPLRGAILLLQNTFPWDLDWVQGPKPGSGCMNSITTLRTPFWYFVCHGGRQWAGYRHWLPAYLSPVQCSEAGDKHITSRWGGRRASVSWELLIWWHFLPQASSANSWARLHPPLCQP